MDGELPFRTFSFGIFQHIDQRFCLVLHSHASVSSYYVVMYRSFPKPIIVFQFEPTLKWALAFRPVFVLQLQAHCTIYVFNWLSLKVVRGRGTWDVGTWGHGDAGTWDMGTRDFGTQRRAGIRGHDKQIAPDFCAALVKYWKLVYVFSWHVQLILVIKYCCFETCEISPE